MAKRFTCDGGVVQHLGADHLAQEFMLRQLLREVVVVGQFFHLTHTVDQDHFFKAFISFGVADDAHIRCHAGAGAQQVQVFTRQQIVNQQRASGFATHHNFVAHLDVLQFGGKGAVGYLDA